MAGVSILRESFVEEELNNFPEYYQNYSWEGKHRLFGYPADSYPDFPWIASLEARFIWLRENSQARNTASIYLLREMIEWGGSQNGVLQKFTDGSGEINLYLLIQDVIQNLNDPNNAIRAALNIPGLGLTYASKLLRFMKPGLYGALDLRIRSALSQRGLLPRIYDGHINSMVAGYMAFLELVNNLNAKLKEREIRKPDCNLSDTGIWRPSEIEMAIFRWAELQ